MSDMTPRSDAITRYVTGLDYGQLPDPVVDMARQCLADFLAVSIAAHDNQAVMPVRALAASWGADGNAPVIMGKQSAAPVAALVNGTMAHALDLDDVHHLGGGHPSAPCWASVFSSAAARGASEDRAITAFVAGYEVMTRLGGGGPNGVGRSLHFRGFHPTSVFGRTGATVGAGLLLGLAEPEMANALGLVGTTAGGLVNSFGTHAKPFHAGKAAMDGVIAAELAASGMQSAHNLYEIGTGLLPVLLDPARPDIPALDFGSQWYLLENGFKMYSCCRATHASIEAAQEISSNLAVSQIAEVDIFICPSALVVAGIERPTTGVEGRFSVAYCASMALHGYRMLPDDFDKRAPADVRVDLLLDKITCRPTDDMPEGTARISVKTVDGQTREATVNVMKGHPERPLGWAGVEDKFMMLCAPVLGDEKAGRLFQFTKGFSASEKSFSRMIPLLAAG